METATVNLAPDQPTGVEKREAGPINITKDWIEKRLREREAGKLTFPASGRLRFYDEAQRGFGLTIYQTGRVVFWVQKSGGATVTYKAPFDPKGETAGTVKMARTWATGVLNDIASGKLGGQSRITLRKALALYEQRTDLAARTIETAGDLISRHAGDWLERALAKLTKADVKARHKKITDGSGPYAANNFVRYLSAVYGNAAAEEDLSLPQNPCQTVRLNEEERVASPVSDLRAWWLKVGQLSNPIRRDYQVFVLLTGLRRSDAATVRWDHVDFGKGELHRPSPKGGKSRAFTIPLSTVALAILKHRRVDNERWYPDSVWVFPAESESGHIEEVKEQKQVDRKKVMHLPSPHRLRDTYLTVATECSVPKLVQKMLANHSFAGKSDVTEGYVSLGADFLRDAQERITAELLKRMRGPALAAVLRALSGRPATVDDAAAELASWATV